MSLHHLLKIKEIYIVQDIVLKSKYILEKRALKLCYERLRDCIKLLFNSLNKVISLRSSLIVEDNFTFNISGQKSLTILLSAAGLIDLLTNKDIHIEYLKFH